MLASSTRAGGRFNGSLRVGAGYDDSLLQDATSVGGGLLSSSLDLGYRARAFRDLSASLSGHVSTLNQPNATSQDLVDVGTQGRVAWRFFDCLSPLLEGSASRSTAPQAGTLDSSHLGYGAGLRADVLDRGWVEGLATGGSVAYPQSDLDSNDQGVLGRLDFDLPASLRLRAQVQSQSRRFTESYLYTSTSASVGSTLRQDQALNWEASLAWEQATLGTAAFGRGGQLSSNGDSIDYGPHQNQYNNTYIPLGPPGFFLNDNTWMKDYYSQRSQGGGLRAWGQWGGFSAQAQTAVDDIQFLGRFAKGADDKFLAGSPLLQERIVQGGLDLSYLWPLGPVDLDLSAAWTTWAASSNDSLYSYHRNLSTLDLALLF